MTKDAVIVAEMSKVSPGVYEPTGELYCRTCNARWTPSKDGHRLPFCPHLKEKA
jgi:hypothetical protein